MKFSRLTLFFLFVLIIVIPNLAQKANITPKEDELALEKMLAGSIDSLQSNASTEAQLSALSLTVQLFMSKRVAANVRGYEKTPDFQKGFRESISEFSDINPTKIDALKDKETRFLKDSMLSAYKENKEQFDAFYENVLKNDSQLKGYTKEDILKTIFQFSALLYQKDHKSWESASRVTYFWPFCIPQ